ncbi:MAG: hypothetical protein ACYCW6_20520 [Candidatus Xenobia bacterium]
MQLKRSRLYERVPARAELGIWGDLRGDFGGLLSQVKEGYWGHFGLRFAEIGDARPGDVFLTDGGILLYYYVAPNREFVEAGVLLPTSDGQHVYQGFCERVRESIFPGAAGRDLPWRPVVETNQVWHLLHEEASRLIANGQELNAARMLSDEAQRVLLRRILTAGPLSLEALAGTADQVAVSNQVRVLEETGLLGREFIIGCKKTGREIARVKTLDEIEMYNRSGFKCPHCGAGYLEEKLDQLLSCTDNGNRMARPNYWLALTMLQILEKLKIPSDSILHYADKTYNVLDVFVHHDGQFLMIEPHDLTVKLHEAWLFETRARYYRPQVAILLSARPFSKEVARFVQQGLIGENGSSDTPRLVMVDDVTKLEPVLRDLFEAWQRKTLKESLQRFTPGTQVDLGSLVLQYFFGAEESIGERVDEPDKPEEDVPLPHEPETQMIDEHVEHGREQPMEPEGSMVPITPEAAAEPEPAEPTDEVVVPEDTSYTEPNFEEFWDPGFRLEPSAPNPEELRDQALKKVLDELATSPLAGRIPLLESTLRESTLSLALVSDEGLLLASALETEQPAELVAALAVDVQDAVQRALADAMLPPSTQITVRGEGAHFSFHPTQGALLLLHEKRSWASPADDTLHQTEMELRDAIFKKVLDRLAAQDGVVANVVINRDGMVIESQAEGLEDRVDMWAGYFSQMLNDAEKSVHRMGAKPLRQMLIWTSEYLISVIPLDKEGILASILEPGAPRDTYLTRLIQEADQLTSVFL